MNKRERRFLQSEVLVEAGESPKITGYAAVFGKRSFLLGDFVEVVDSKAFDECLASNPTIVGLINHDESLVMGKTTSGTMRVSVDEVGLKYEIDPPDTSYAKDLMVSMRRKDIDSSSFGFFCRADSWAYDKVTKQNVRTILKADVFDCSIVLNPAYGDSSSQVRSLFPEDKGSIPEEITAKIAELRHAQRKEHRFKNITAAVAGVKWAIQSEKLETICALLNSRAAGVVATKEEIQAAMMGNESVYQAEPSNGVAVIPVYGVISQRMTMMAEFCGGTSCDKLTSQLRAAVADESIKTIVLDIDSPGGTVTGVPELAAEIMKLREQKEIIGVANGMAASAALWIGASCSKLVVIPSGEVGSIGVYQMHQDVSGALDKAGVNIQFISAGEFKVDGNPYETLSDTAKSDMQAGVDEFYEMFVEGVAAGRNVSVETVKSDFGKGRMLMAKDALKVGLVDSIQTLDEVVSGLLSVDTHVETEEPMTEPSDSGVEVLAQVAKTKHKAEVPECGCDCPECEMGDHEDCTGEDGECDWDDMGDSDDMDDMDNVSTKSEMEDGVVAEKAKSFAESEANANTLLRVKLMSL
jgi:HK97 family phage prohead protease